MKDRKECIFLAVASHLKSAVIRAANTSIIGTKNLIMTHLDYIIGEPITDVVSRALEPGRTGTSDPSN